MTWRVKFLLLTCHAIYEQQLPARRSVKEKMAMLRKPACAILIILISAMVAEASSSSSLVTFIFGDSLTEVGNNNYLRYSLAKSNYPWYGIDFSGGQATGRFTNGRTIGDIICNFFLIILFSSFHSRLYLRTS